MIFHKYTDPDGKNHYRFYCPACKHGHSVNDNWTFNGNMESPTLQSSVGVNMPSHPGYQAHLPTCHSQITNGQIYFYGDSTAGLAGQTMPLPDFPPNYGLD